MGARRTFPDDKSWKRRRDSAGGEGTPQLRVATGAQTQDEVRLGVDAIVGEGARRMLAAALEAEVEDDLATHAAERDAGGRRLVVRNGHARQRQVTTAAGAILVRAPRVDDRRTDLVRGGRSGSGR